MINSLTSPMFLLGDNWSTLNDLHTILQKVVLWSWAFMHCYPGHWWFWLVPLFVAALGQPGAIMLGTKDQVIALTQRGTPNLGNLSERHTGHHHVSNPQHANLWIEVCETCTEPLAHHAVWMDVTRSLSISFPERVCPVMQLHSRPSGQGR